jgi:hypothetical protein
MIKQAIVFISLLLTSFLEDPAAKKEILLVGSIHHIDSAFAGNWHKLKTTLLNYKPDMICVEYRLPTDTLSLQNSMGKNIFYRLDSIGRSWITEENKLSEESLPFRAEIKKFSQYYVTADFANANFHAFKLNRYFERELDKNSSNGIVKQVRRIKNSLMRNEYWNVVFPVADSLKISYLYPVDDWTYNLDFSLAYQSWSAELKGTDHLKKWTDFFAEFGKTENARIQSLDALEFVNAAEWQKNTDYGQSKILLDAGNKSYQEWVDLWHKRNNKIASNILEVTNKHQSTRTAVVFGYMHIPVIKAGLAALDKNFTVKNYGQR